MPRHFALRRFRGVQVRFDEGHFGLVGGFGVWAVREVSFLSFCCRARRAQGGASRAAAPGDAFSSKMAGVSSIILLLTVVFYCKKISKCSASALSNKNNAIFFYLFFEISQHF